MKEIRNAIVSDLSQVFSFHVRDFGFTLWCPWDQSGYQRWYRYCTEKHKFRAHHELPKASALVTRLENHHNVKPKSVFGDRRICCSVFADSIAVGFPELDQLTLVTVSLC